MLIEESKDKHGESAQVTPDDHPSKEVLAIHDIDSEKNGSNGSDSEDGTYFVRENTADAHDGLKLAQDGFTVLIPQPSDDIEDPLNWSWGRKHKVLLALLLPSLLTDSGMTWGSTLFQAQAATWNISIAHAAQSVSGGIFMQGPGGLIAGPLCSRYGRLPVLFWSQALGTIMVTAATFSPSYASFTAFRTLQGFTATAPQVIGLSVVHDIFFFHERTRKVGLWTFLVLVGPLIGPFVSSFLLEVVSWQLDMGILAMIYGLSTALVVLLGEETLYNRQSSHKPTAGSSRLSVLLGIAGAKAKNQTSLVSMSKYLARMSIKPQLLLPCLFICVIFTWVIGITVTLTQFVRPPPYSLSNTQVSCLYLAPTLGAITGELWGHFFNDFLQTSYIRTHKGRYLPENRLWAVYPNVILTILGLVLYGQVLQRQLSVVGLAAAWAITMFANMAASSAIAAYALDSYPQHAALASAWINFWRTTGGFCVAYFQTQWVARSGAATVFGVQAATVAASLIFIILPQVYGRRWRIRFPPPKFEGVVNI